MSDFGGSTQDRTADPPDYRSGCSEPTEHQSAIKSIFFNKDLKTKKSLNERLLVEAHGIEPRTLCL